MGRCPEEELLPESIESPARFGENDKLRRHILNEIERENHETLTPIL